MMKKDPLSFASEEALIQGLPQYSLRPEKHAEILKALDNLRLQNEEADGPVPWLKVLRRFWMPFATVTAVMVLVVTGVLSQRENSYAYHLDKARVALVELEQVLRGDSRTSFLIPAAYAAPKGVNEAKVATLSVTVTIEMEKAIEIASAIQNPHAFKTALTAINAVQERALLTLSDAAEVVEEEPVAKAVTLAIAITAQEQEKIHQSLEVADEAIAKGERMIKVKVDLKAKTALNKPERQEPKKEAQSQLVRVRATLEDLQAKGTDEKKIAPLERKVEKAEAALRSGKDERSWGLSTAALAESKRLLLKHQKRQKAEKQKSRPSALEMKEKAKKKVNLREK